MSVVWHRLKDDRPPEFYCPADFRPNQRKAVEDVNEEIRRRWKGENLGLSVYSGAARDYVAAFVLPEFGIAVAEFDNWAWKERRKIWVLEDRDELITGAARVVWKTPLREDGPSRLLDEAKKWELATWPHTGSWRVLVWRGIAVAMRGDNDFGLIRAGGVRFEFCAYYAKGAYCVREVFERALEVEVRDETEAKGALVLALFAGKIDLEGEELE